MNIVRKNSSPKVHYLKKQKYRKQIEKWGGGIGPFQHNVSVPVFNAYIYYVLKKNVGAYY